MKRERKETVKRQGKEAESGVVANGSDVGEVRGGGKNEARVSRVGGCRAALKKGGLGEGKAGEGGGEPTGPVSCVVFVGYIINAAPPGAARFTFYKEWSTHLFGWIAAKKVPILEPPNNSVRSTLFFSKRKLQAYRVVMIDARAPLVGDGAGGPAFKTTAWVPRSIPVVQRLQEDAQENGPSGERLGLGTE